MSNTAILAAPLSKITVVETDNNGAETAEVLLTSKPIGSWVVLLSPDWESRVHGRFDMMDQFALAGREFSKDARGFADDALWQYFHG